MRVHINIPACGLCHATFTTKTGMTLFDDNTNNAVVDMYLPTRTYSGRLYYYFGGNRVYITKGDVIDVYYKCRQAGNKLMRLIVQ